MFLQTLEPHKQRTDLIDILTGSCLPRKLTRHGLQRLLLVVVGQRGSGLRLGGGKELPTQEVDGVWRGLLECGEAGCVQSGC